MSLLDKMKAKKEKEGKEEDSESEELEPEPEKEPKPKIQMKLKPKKAKKVATKAKPKITTKLKKEPEPEKEPEEEEEEKTLSIDLKAKAKKAAVKKIQSETKSAAVQITDGSTWILGLIGKYGTGKTKRAMDTEKLLPKGKKMLYLDPEAKADKMKAIWHPEGPIDIINFLRYDPETYDTMEIATIDELREEFQKDWKKKLKSGKYGIFVMDKINVLWPFCVDYWLKLNPKRKKPLPTDYGEVYGIALKKIFYPVINCCRENGVNIVFCSDIKGDYRHNEEIGKKPALHEILLGQMDYMFWLEWDYEVYCIKNIYKPFWTVRDEDVDFADYFQNREFILEDKEVSNIYIEYKTYNDFMEDTLLSSIKRVEKKKSFDLLKKNTEN